MPEFPHAPPRQCPNHDMRASRTRERAATEVAAPEGAEAKCHWATHRSAASRRCLALVSEFSGGRGTNASQLNAPEIPAKEAESGRPTPSRNPFSTRESAQRHPKVASEQGFLSRRSDSNRGPLHYEGKTSKGRASTCGHGRVRSRWKVAVPQLSRWTRARSGPGWRTRLVPV
jgi:hypothetical protein